MGFLKYACSFLNSLHKRVVETGEPMDDVVRLYGVCNIDFQKHYKYIETIQCQPPVTQDGRIDALTDHSVVRTVWHNLILELIDRFEFLLCNPVLVKRHAQVVHHLVTKVVNQYINTMVLVVEKCTLKMNWSSVTLLKNRLFDPIYIYIHGLSLITHSLLSFSIDPFYQSGLIDTRYEIPPPVNHMIKVNHDDVLTTFQSIVYETSPAGKLSSIQSTIEVINHLYSKNGLVATTDELIPSLANVIHHSNVPFILNELQFCKTFLCHVFQSYDADYNVLNCTEHSNQATVGKLYFCFTTFEATLQDILLHI